MLGAGISLRLKAVQVIKLVEGKSNNVFKEEDGFEATPERTNSNVQSTEVQTSSDF